MRPASIHRFDQLYLGATALSFANALFVYFSTMAPLGSSSSRDGLSRLFAGYFIGSSAISFAISLLLWFFISRKASKVAKWVLVVFNVIAILGSLPLFSDTQLLMWAAVPLWQIVLSSIISAMNLAALWFLFQPDAKAWFAYERQGY